MKKNLFALFLFAGIINAYAQTELTDTNAQTKLLVNNDRLIVLDFYATWCTPCKRMDPILKELEEEYGDRVDFYKIDIDKNEVDDALGITAVPTYLFIKNSSNLEQVEGSMSKEMMERYIKKHMDGTDEEIVITSTEGYLDGTKYDVWDKHGDSDEFGQDVLDSIWDSWEKLNSLSWHAYEEHDNVKDLLKAIKAIERSIELEANYYNTDTHAALLYKTGNYTKALKVAKKAIDYAKSEELSYEDTSELIVKIIEEM